MKHSNVTIWDPTSDLHRRVGRFRIALDALEKRNNCGVRRESNYDTLVLHIS
jgi:hypothetical protein